MFLVLLCTVHQCTVSLRNKMFVFIIFHQTLITFLYCCLGGNNINQQSNPCAKSVLHYFRPNIQFHLEICHIQLNLLWSSPSFCHINIPHHHHIQLFYTCVNEMWYVFQYDKWYVFVSTGEYMLLWYTHMIIHFCVCVCLYLWMSEMSVIQVYC